MILQICTLILTQVENLHGAFMSDDFCVSGVFFMLDVLKSLLKLLKIFQRKDFERIKIYLVILE